MSNFSISNTQFAMAYILYKGVCTYMLCLSQFNYTSVYKTVSIVVVNKY